MRIRTGAVVLTLAGCALFAAGCKNDQQAGSAPAGSAPAGSAGAAAPAGGDAKSELVAAVRADAKTSYRFQSTVTGPASVSSAGVFDPASRSLTMDDTTGAAKFKMIMVGSDAYIQFPAGDGPLREMAGKWMHLDLSRMKSLGGLGLQDPGDPLGVNTYQQAITSVRKTGAGHYEGTLDPSKTPLASAAGKAPGAPSLGSVSFQATIDGQGRLTSMDSTTTAGGQQVHTKITMSDFGTPVSVAKPSGSSVVEAPTSLFGGA